MVRWHTISKEIEVEWYRHRSRKTEEEREREGKEEKIYLCQNCNVKRNCGFEPRSTWKYCNLCIVVVVVVVWVWVYRPCIVGNPLNDFKSLWASRTNSVRKFFLSLSFCCQYYKWIECAMTIQIAIRHQVKLIFFFCFLFLDFSFRWDCTFKEVALNRNNWSLRIPYSSIDWLVYLCCVCVCVRFLIPLRIPIHNYREKFKWPQKNGYVVFRIRAKLCDCCCCCF